MVATKTASRAVGRDMLLVLGGADDDDMVFVLSSKDRHCCRRRGMPRSDFFRGARAWSQRRGYAGALNSTGTQHDTK